ncbi:DNA/RNA nuclease SfsA [Bartonella sp. HY329]|uniref:DNA/RNA nuclease SfsA n=1 Tax=unclassified Bartonella TaxID=2645622 RepID=UPI0021C749E3|nr:MULTISPECIES: DNA/RNA nuclease SfsA [unclassified Bartonella]UXM93885.1 DNA/RNA nuclease SfsA [Bartonella sp. HY329]UXN08206.1 DNA/RNA nuclease SfsA [Bartonella sp. HY328]
MLFTSPLTPARLIKRYKRFLADVILENGDEITVSVPNTGSMRGLLHENGRVWLSHSVSPTRKYQYRLEIVESNNILVGINTSIPNKIAEEAIQIGLVADLSGYSSILREQHYGSNSRVDLLLRDTNKVDTYVEVKNVHFMREKGLAEFPDTVTTRGTKHLRELAKMVEQGKRAIMLFVIQREDCDKMSICADLDPIYGEEFQLARKKGVEAFAIGCKIDIEKIEAYRPLPIIESPIIESMDN